MKNEKQSKGVSRCKASRVILEMGIASGSWPVYISITPNLEGIETMREGIYLDRAPESDDDPLTGFVVFMRHHRLQVSCFTRCTLPHIKEHAKGRFVDGPVYITTPNPKP